ncbi:MAG: acetyltransferase [Roseimicrobium sp.]
MNLPRSLLILGGGEHARVLAEAALSRAGEWCVSAYVHHGPQSGLAEICPDAQPISTDEVGMRTVSSHFCILGMGGINSVRRRRRLVVQYAAAGARWATVVHASAWVSASATIGEGAVIMAGAVVNAGARIGAHCVVNSGAILEHDVVLGDNASVAPRVVVGGGAKIGEDVWLGLGCSIRDHIEIGAGTIVGMGAAVVKSLPARVCAWGVPASITPLTC